MEDEHGKTEQPDDAGAFHSVAFVSRKLTQPERSYPPHLLELLAVVHALKALRVTDSSRDNIFSISPSSCDGWQRKFPAQAEAERYTEKYLCFSEYRVEYGCDSLSTLRTRTPAGTTGQKNALPLVEHSFPLTVALFAIKFLSSSDFI